MEKVVTRIPPSPSGMCHIGTARTALFNFLFAKKYGGECLLRFEDTNKEKSNAEAVSDIEQSLLWLGIAYDRVWKQSERLVLYKEKVKELIDGGYAYRSSEIKEGESEETSVVRFKNPHTRIAFNDVVRGEISIDISDLGDFIIERGDGTALYHLCVVVDDGEMGVTHILRGDDHISNTPRQIALMQALGYPQPVYAHFPLIHGVDGKKLSKRNNAFSVLSLKEAGFLSDAVSNYLLTLGWTPEEDSTEFFSFEEMKRVFTLEGLSKSKAIYDEAKLKWYNKHYIQTLPLDTIERIVSKKASALWGDAFDTSQEKKNFLLTHIQEKSETLIDMESAIGDYMFLFNQPDINITVSEKYSNREKTKTHITHIISLLDAVNIWEEERIREVLMPYAEKEGKGEVLWPFRFILTGLEKSPEGIAVAYILGKVETLQRMRSALSYYE